jgi:hypothetical protein
MVTIHQATCSAGILNGEPNKYAAVVMNLYLSPLYLMHQVSTPLVSKCLISPQDPLEEVIHVELHRPLLNILL